MNTAALWYFESVNLYQILCPHKVKTMAEKHTYNTYKKDQYIYFPSEQATHIYMIVSGRVRIGHNQENGTEVITAILTTGEIFGELALAGEDVRKDFAQAMESTIICPLSLGGIESLDERQQRIEF